MGLKQRFNKSKFRLINLIINTIRKKGKISELEAQSLRRTFNVAERLPKKSVKPNQPSTKKRH